MTGGMKAPSDGALKMTMESLSRVWACEEVATSARTAAQAADTTRNPITKRSKFQLCDPKHLLRQAARDRGDLVGLEPGRRHDLRRLIVADRERHVGAHHHTIGADHLDDKSQHPRIVQDAVGVEHREAG